MTTPPHGLARLLHASLGARWQHLHPDIRARFTLAPTIQRQSFTGTMHAVDRSFIGWLIAKLIAFVRILPATRARDVPFAFHLSSAQGAGWIKERLYHFADGRFEFRSMMRIADNGDLIEQFPYGLGMKIKLGAEGDNGDTLYFRDDGYFLRIGACRLPLPRWLTVGRFTLAHRNIDVARFTVEIRLDHPLFGRLFHQHGTFSEAIACVAAARAPAAAPARAARPDTARRAAPGIASL
jgi:Domain of unknown function (DUF4166)